MPKPQHLLQRRNTYYLRLRVPQDLLTAYKPKKEIIRSLKTQDFAEARKLVTIAKANLEAEFEAKRKQQTTTPGTDALAQYSDHELLALTSKWMAQLKKEEAQRRIKDIGQTWTEERKAEFYIELQQEELEARQEALNISTSEKHEGMTVAAQFLQSEGLSFDRKSENFRKIGYFFSKAIHELAHERLKEWQGQSVANNYAPLPSTTLRPVSLKALCEEYIKDPGKVLSQSTRNNYKIIFRALFEIVGENAPAQSITREHCKEIRQLIIGLPKNTTKRVGQQPLKKAVMLAQKNKWELLAPATVNMYLHKLHALLEFAVREEYLDKNPARNLSVPDKVKKKDKRYPFEDEQLKRIFQAPLYTGCMDDQNGYNKPGSQRPRNTRFWIPLIGLWTGMRMNEICQLRTEDIANKGGIDLFIVEECEDETIANKIWATICKVI